MTVYQHEIGGTLPEGDIWATRWTSASSLPLASSHANTLTWTEIAWTGSEGNPGIASLVPAATTVQYAKTTALTASTPLKSAAVQNDFLDLPGTNTHNALPQRLSELVSLRTDAIGSKGRGRMYLPAACVDSVATDGKLESSVVTVLENCLNLAWGTVVTTGELIVIVGRLTGVTEAVVQFGVSNTFATQRRRDNKVDRIRSFVAMPGG